MFQDQEPHSQSNLQKFSDLYIFLNIQNERFSYSLKLQLISLERRTSNCEGDSKFEIQDSNLNLNLNLEFRILNHPHSSKFGVRVKLTGV